LTIVYCIIIKSNNYCQGSAVVVYFLLFYTSIFCWMSKNCLQENSRALLTSLSKPLMRYIDIGAFHNIILLLRYGSRDLQLEILKIYIITTTNPFGPSKIYKINNQDLSSTNDTAEFLSQFTSFLDQIFQLHDLQAPSTEWFIKDLM
jgi:hypothetical protein